MRELGLSGSSVGYRDSERSRVAAEGTGERGQAEAGEEELSAGLPAAEQPLHQSQAAGGRSRGAEGRWLSLEL